MKKLAKKNISRVADLDKAHKQTVERARDKKAIIVLFAPLFVECLSQFLLFTKEIFCFRARNEMGKSHPKLEFGFPFSLMISYCFGTAKGKQKQASGGEEGAKPAKGKGNIEYWHDIFLLNTKLCCSIQ